MTQAIKIYCPSCSTNLAEDDVYGNILHCPQCGSCNYFDKGIYNTNVFFGLVGSKASDYDGLKEILIEQLTQNGVRGYRRKIKYIRIERILIPVREFLSQGRRTYVSMVDIHDGELAEMKTIHEILSHHLDAIETIFPMNTIRPLRTTQLAQTTDRNGQIYRTKVLPISRSKWAVDEAYDLDPHEMMRILYIPVYQLSFSQKGEVYVCMGDDQLTGLPISKLSKLNHKYSEKDDMLQECNSLAFSIAFFLAVLFMIYMVVTTIMGYVENGCDGLLSVIISLLCTIIVSIVVPTVTLAAPVWVIFFSCVNVFYAFMDRRQRIFRQFLVKKFDYRTIKV